VEVGTNIEVEALLVSGRRSLPAYIRHHWGGNGKDGKKEKREETGWRVAVPSSRVVDGGLWRRNVGRNRRRNWIFSGGGDDGGG